MVAVVGAGYWGKNLVRNFAQLGALHTVCDASADSLAAQVALFPGIATAQSYEAVLADPAIRGVVLATPAVHHFEHAKAALLAGKDVFVEKPLALHYGEGAELVDLADARGSVLMVGHILEYHPAVTALKALVRDGEMGQVWYIYSNRLNLGKVRQEENILWSFAPHDIAVICALLDQGPTAVSAAGGSYLQAGLADVTVTNLQFAAGVRAHIFVSWLHPYKEQRLVVIGDRKMAVFDDTVRVGKLKLYDKGIAWQDGLPVVRQDAETVLEVVDREPMREECADFLACIRERRAPLTDGRSALRVLGVLEAAQRSLGEGGRVVELREVVDGADPEPEPDNRDQLPAYFAHPTAVIDDGASIGAGTKIWHFCHVSGSARIGERSNLGQNVFVAPDVVIGNNVKIQNNVSLYTGVVVEDDVFLGPSAVFTNVLNPRSHVSRKDEYRPTRIGQGASVGANATIVCGTALGRYAFVGAGAVVTRDVPDYALVYGNPARIRGWMCQCGVQLGWQAAPEDEPGDEVATCAACGAEYVKRDDRVRPKSA